MFRKIKKTKIKNNIKKENIRLINQIINIQTKNTPKKQNPNPLIIPQRQTIMAKKTKINPPSKKTSLLKLKIFLM
jgi:signal recognition particle subunit SEC65